MKKIGIIVGSLRKSSFSKQIAKNIALMFQNEFITEFIKIDKLPLFNQDLENEHIEACENFKERIKKVDGFVFVTPEYNRSIPGCLKNALDIGSRSPQGSLWQGKPVLIVSDSIGSMGGFGASQHLKQVALSVGMKIIQPSEIYLGHVASLLDDQQFLTNEAVANILVEAVKSLSDFVLMDSDDMSDIKITRLLFKVDQTSLLALNMHGIEMGAGNFYLDDQRIVITNITVDDEYRGKGLAARLVLKFISLANLFDLKIVPECPYAKSFFDKFGNAKFALG